MLRFSSNGDALVHAWQGRVIVHQANGSRRPLVPDLVRDVAVCEDEVWIVRDDGDGVPQLTRMTLSGADGPPVALFPDPSARLIGCPFGPPSALWHGAHTDEIRAELDRLVTRRIATGVELAVPLGGRRHILAGPERRWLQHDDRELPLNLPSGPMRSGAALLGGRAVLLLFEAEPASLLFAWLDGTGAAEMAWSGASAIAVASGAALALVRADELVLVDVLAGGRSVVRAPKAIDSFALSPDGDLLALAHDDEVTVVATSALLGLQAQGGAARTAMPVQPRLGGEGVPALARLRPRPRLEFCTADEAVRYLNAQLEVVGSLAARAIARGWDSGRLVTPERGALPYEREVAGILGEVADAATEQRAAAEGRVVLRRAALAAATPERMPPLAALAAELGLTPLAQDILLVTAAPLLAGELARLYGILANDPGRALVDELLIHQILEPDGVSRYELAAELDGEAPLLRYGLVRAHGKDRPFSALTVDPLVLRRLRGQLVEPAPGEPTQLVAAQRPLESLFIAKAVKDRLIEQVGGAGPPLRLAVRGQVGSGRRTLLAALAEQANRPLGLIDATLLPREPQPRLAALAAELKRATLRGWLACVSGLEAGLSDEPTFRDKLRDLFRAHPDPLALRLPMHTPIPFDPGYVLIDLPPLTEAERIDCFTAALTRRGLATHGVAELAARYRVGPGVIERAVELAAAESTTDVVAAAEAAIRQHLDVRLGSVAQRVERLPTWSQVILPAEVMESLREFTSRVKHRQRVYERWGFDRMITTARGLTALFQGGPGTGKTLVAGALARELGLDLYRIDLSRVLSKWIGETEQNLAAVFDAAEDGQAILLFDEADALFTKRTEVKSSVDRYANLEVNYLLQRLDSFNGIAILTTNFGGGIDSAFKRRLTFRITFPFPDEDGREALWRAHLPPELPTSGPFDLARIARKYQLSGGYIRNAALRAAFLAAAEEQSLTHAHLERAVELEFRDVGKLAQSGMME